MLNQLCSRKMVKKLAVKFNTLLNARLVLIYNFYTGLMKRLAGVAEGLPGVSHWYVNDMNK